MQGPLRSLHRKLSFPAASNPSRCWAFLCDHDGQVVRDFSESVPADSLVSLMEPVNWINFLEAVRIHGAYLEERPIQFEGSRSSLLLHGCQTSSGIFAFATLTPTKTSSERDDDANEILKVVHDLNNPISSIVSSCEYLTEYSQENLSPEQLEMIAIIDASARTLLRLSVRIAELSRRH